LSQDISVSQMQWKPKLLKLTGIHAIDQPEVYMDPAHVHLIQRTNAKVDGSDSLVLCTLIYWCGNRYIHVKESVEEVARLCDEAFGYKENLRSVK